MNKQLTFSLIIDELAQAKTSKKKFLEKIERIIPFDEWVEIIKPCYYKGEYGNKPLDELEYKVYKKRAIIIAIVEVVVSILLKLIGLDRLFVAVVYSFAVLGFMLIIGTIKNALKAKNKLD